MQFTHVSSIGTSARPPKRFGGGLYGRGSGFTIIELMIVIAVIGILASITVVAYNGIQNRARMAQLAAALHEYEIAFQLYKVDHGEYPRGVTAHCLGQASDYPAGGGYAAGQCSFTDSNYTIGGGDLAAALQPYLPKSPAFPLITTTYSIAGRTTRGLYYEGTYNYHYFEYGLPEGQTCPYGKDAWSNQEVLCTVMVYEP